MVYPQKYISALDHRVAILVSIARKAIPCFRQTFAYNEGKILSLK